MIRKNFVESECIEHLRSLGYEVYKPGWPDFLCTKNKEIIAVEAKSTNDKLKFHQKQTIEILEQAGLPIFIYKNKELKDLNGQNIPLKNFTKIIKHYSLLPKNMFKDEQFQSNFVK